MRTPARRSAAWTYCAIFRTPSLLVTSAVKRTGNKLEIKVVNVWVNRLIGDEHEPADCEWNNGDFGYGGPLKAFPDWFIKGQPRPSPGRYTFTTWNYFTKDSPLPEAGLIGPVKLQVEAVVDVAQ